MQRENRENRENKRKICMGFFSQKGCNNEKCNFSHKKINKLCKSVTTYISDGVNSERVAQYTTNCIKGEYCPYYHQKKDIQCKYYFSQKNCKYDNNCIFQHEKNGECYFYGAFGYCKYKKRCKRNHKIRWCPVLLSGKNCNHDLEKQKCDAGSNFNHEIPVKVKEMYDNIIEKKE